MKHDCNCTTLAEFLPFVAISIAICVMAILITFTYLRNRAQKEGGL